MMSTYMIPKKVLKNISSSLLRYWWNTSKGKKPIYWRKREVLEEHRNNGGIYGPEKSNNLEPGNTIQTSMEDKSEQPIIG